MARKQNVCEASIRESADGLTTNRENVHDEYRCARERLNSLALELAPGFPDPLKIAQAEFPSTAQAKRKTKRRGQSEGTVFFRKSDGRWVASVNVGWRGAHRRRLYAYRATQADAINALATLRQLHERGLSADSANLTLTEYANRWITALDVKPRTSASYKWLLDSYVLPALGGYKLSAIRARDVRRLLGEYEDTPKHRPPRQGGSLRAVFGRRR